MNNLKAVYSFKNIFYFFLLNLAFVACSQVLITIEKKLSQPVEFAFNPALPVEGYLPGAAGEISKITLAGSFNGWNPLDEKYTLQPAGAGLWKLSLKLRPGPHEYKFVIHRKSKKDGAMLWHRDASNPNKRDDALGGYNSVIKIRSVSNLIAFFKTLHYVFLFCILAVLTLQPLTQYLFFIKIRLKFKLLLLSNILVIFITLLKLSYDIGRDCDLLKKADSIESRYLLRLIEPHVKSGVMAGPTNSQAIERALNRFIGDFLIQTTTVLPSETRQHSLMYVSVFDDKNHLLASAFPAWQSAFIEKNRLSRADFQKKAVLFFYPAYKKGSRLCWGNFAVTSSDGLFKRIFYSVGTYVPGALVLSGETDARLALRDRLQNILYNAYNGWCLVKIEYNNVSYGYFVFDNKSYTQALFGKTLQSVIYFYLISSIISIIIFLGFGRVIISVIGKLDLAFREAGRDRLDKIEVTNTGDELENISESYNYMIDGLKAKTRLLPYVSKSAWDHAHKRAALKADSLTGEKKIVTILFLDIVGFSALSAKHPPDVIVRILNSFFDDISRLITEQGGQIDKFIGDAAMAVFEGEPAESAQNAVKSALKIQAALAQSSGIEALKTRIGIHTGEVIMGDIGGADSRRDYTCIGENVNRAQRLETACTAGRILLSAETFSYVKEHVAVERKEALLKGFDKTVTAYEIADLKWI